MRRTACQGGRAPADESTLDPGAACACRRRARGAIDRGLRRAAGRYRPPAGSPLGGSRTFPYDRCYASPLLRCRQTLEALSPTVAVQFDDDLREIDFGRWENRTFDEAAADDPALTEQWAAFDPELTFPGGENLGRFLLRVQSAADRLTADEADTVLVVSHGGVIRMMLCYLLGCDPRQYLAFGIGYGALTVVDVFERRGVLTRLEPCEIGEDGDG